jgi:hypothetical protein
MLLKPCVTVKTLITLVQFMSQLRRRPKMLCYLNAITRWSEGQVLSPLLVRMSHGQNWVCPPSSSLDLKDVNLWNQTALLAVRNRCLSRLGLMDHLFVHPKGASNNRNVLAGAISAEDPWVHPLPASRQGIVRQDRLGRERVLIYHQGMRRGALGFGILLFLKMLVYSLSSHFPRQLLH